MPHDGMAPKKKLSEAAVIRLSTSDLLAQCLAWEVPTKGVGLLRLRANLHEAMHASTCDGKVGSDLKAPSLALRPKVQAKPCRAKPRNTTKGPCRRQARGTASRLNLKHPHETSTSRSSGQDRFKNAGKAESMRQQIDGEAPLCPEPLSPEP